MPSISPKAIYVLVICAVFILLAMVPVVRADSVTYTFTGTSNALGGDGLSLAFQYTTSGFIEPNPASFFLRLLASQLDSCTNCQVSSTFPAIAFSEQGPTFGDQIQFNDYTGHGSVFAFRLGAFEAPGTYFSPDPWNSGTLVVSTVVTPEPTTLFLLGIGSSWLFLLVRRIAPGSARACSRPDCGPAPTAQREKSPHFMRFVVDFDSQT